MQVVDLSTFQVKSFKLSRFQDVELSRSKVQDVDIVELSKMRIFLHHTFESENVRFPFL